MRLNEQNILVVTIEDWQNAGLTYTQYENSKRRGHIKTTSVGGNGRKVEIIYESLPERFKEAFLATIGNPYEALTKQSFEQYLNADDNALRYYQNFILPDGTGLPEDAIDACYKAVQYLNFIIEGTGSPAKMKKVGAKNKEEFYKYVIDKVTANKVQIPTNYSNLRAKIRAYNTPAADQPKNYSCLINGKFGNQNTRKISDEAGEWLINEYSRPYNHVYVEELWALYNIQAEKRGWKKLDSHRAVSKFLMQPDIKAQWYAGRHGLNKAKEKYGYTLRTELPQYRDSLWYSDGTKLNFYYKPEKGSLKADMIVYEVIDVHSEVMLGYHIGQKENFIAMYHAFKMSLQFSNTKPYQVKFDNGGGHGKLAKEGFLGKLSRLAHNTQPYNGKSKTIESIFGRFQTHVMRKLWFFTGQNITAKREDSRANMEFITKNATRLPSQEEAMAEYIKCRNEWNNSIHPKYGKPRIEVYFESVNPETRPLDYLDMVDIFWLQTAKPIKYYNHGISLTLDKKKFEYEVLVNGQPDMEFRSQYIDDSFVVKYDPADLSHVRLYKETSNGLQFIAAAEPRLTVPRAIQDFKPGDRARIDRLLEVRNEEVKEMKKRVTKHQEDFENKYYKTPSVDHLKETSMADVIDHAQEFGIYDVM